MIIYDGHAGILMHIDHNLGFDLRHRETDIAKNLPFCEGKNLGGWNSETFRIWRALRATSLLSSLTLLKLRRLYSFNSI